MFHLHRHGLLHEIIVIALTRYHDIDTRTQRGYDLRAQTLLTQIDGRTINLIELHRRYDAQHLELEILAMYDVDIGDEGVDDERGGGAVVQGDLVRFAIDADPCLVTTTYEDELIDRGGDLDKVLGVVKVLDEPFVAVELLSRWLLAAHTLGLLARQRGLASSCRGL